MNGKYNYRRVHQSPFIYRVTELLLSSERPGSIKGRRLQQVLWQWADTVPKNKHSIITIAILHSPCMLPSRIPKHFRCIVQFWVVLIVLYHDTFPIHKRCNNSLSDLTPNRSHWAFFLFFFFLLRISELKWWWSGQLSDVQWVLKTRIHEKHCKNLANVITGTIPISAVVTRMKMALSF